MSNTNCPRLLFVCTGNIGRSQIAQALTRRAYGEAVAVESAGVRPDPALHPMACRIMERRGISFEGQYPKSAQSVADQAFDMVVTIGDPARSLLPDPLRQTGRWVHWDLDDPAQADGTPHSEAAFIHTADWIERHLPAVLEYVRRWQRPLLRRHAGIGTGLWQDGFEPAVHLPAAAAAGFDSIELSLYRFDARDAAAVAELKSVLDDCGMSVASIHAIDGGHLGAADSAHRQRQMDILRHSVDVAVQFDAATIVSHALLLLAADAPPEEPATEQRIADGLHELAELVEPLPTRIAFENGRGNRPSTFAADVLRRLDGHSAAAFGFALDTGHANIAGDLDTIVRDVGARLISLHLNDNDAQRDNHQPPGQGSVDWSSVSTLLHNVGFQGCITYELLGGPDVADDYLARTMRWHQSLISGLAEPVASD